MQCCVHRWVGARTAQEPAQAGTETLAPGDALVRSCGIGARVQSLLSVTVSRVPRFGERSSRTRATASSGPCFENEWTGDLRATKAGRTCPVVAAGAPLHPGPPGAARNTACGWFDSHHQGRTAAPRPGDCNALDHVIPFGRHGGPPGSLAAPAGRSPVGLGPDAPICRALRPPQRQRPPVLREFPVPAGRRFASCLPSCRTATGGSTHGRAPRNVRSPGVAARRLSAASPGSSPGAPAIACASSRAGRCLPCDGARPGACVPPLRWGIRRSDVWPGVCRRRCLPHSGGKVNRVAALKSPARELKPEPRAFEAHQRFRELLQPSNPREGIETADNAVLEQDLCLPRGCSPQMPARGLKHQIHSLLRSAATRSCSPQIPARGLELQRTRHQTGSSGCSPQIPARGLKPGSVPV